MMSAGVRNVRLEVDYPRRYERQARVGNRRYCRIVVHKVFSPSFAALAVAAFLVTPLSITSSSSASTAKVLPCAQSQIFGSIGMGVGAAGTEAYILVLANRSRQACSVEGFATLTFSNEIGSKYHRLQVTADHRRSMLFLNPTPRLVTLRPSEVASFAVSYTQELTPKQDPAVSCRAQWLAVGLRPRTGRPVSVNVEVPINFDVCFSGRMVELTALEAGPIPRSG